MQVKLKALFKDIETVTGNGLADLRGMTTRRTRLAGTTATVVALHALFLWALIAARPSMMNLPMPPDEVLPVELFNPVIPPEPRPIPVERTEEVPEVQPREVQPPEPQPTPQPEPQSQPQPQAKVQAAPYAPMPKPVAASQDRVDTVKTPVIETQKDKRLREAAVPTPTLAAEPNPALKAIAQDADKVETKKTQVVAAPNASDLDLHDAPLPVIQAAPETGLTDKKTKVASAAGGGGAPAGAAGGLAGTGLKGRGAAAQSLQNHNDCAAKQIAGKPVPPGCNMKTLAQMNGLGTGDPASRAYYGPIVSKKEADARYKAEPGNEEYWKRVNAAPTGRFQPNDQPRKGAYSNEKDQRVLGSCGQSDSCGNTK